jgi:hypothetical protein
MFDYRHRPEESPLIWCTHCKELRPRRDSDHVMETVFRIDRAGIFPYGTCQAHAAVHAQSKPVQRNRTPKDVVVATVPSFLFSD